jgi:isopentenyl diphosphate isomerase/L-lactate dehydrogenase-like FMN-dependent dehydrogenase
MDAPTWMRRERPVGERVRDLGGGRQSLLRFAPHAAARPRWAAGFVRDGMRVESPMALRPDGGRMAFWEAAGSLVRRPPTWDDLPWIREVFGGPVVVKGVLSSDDARRAVSEGAAGVVVSNHGGNTLDGLPTTLEALPEVVAAVGDEVDVLLDGGIRRGSDVVKALALGARAVLIGRAYMWGHAAAGAAGVARVLDILRLEIDSTLQLLGCASVEELDESYVRLPRSRVRSS